MSAAPEAAPAPSVEKTPEPLPGKSADKPAEKSAQPDQIIYPRNSPDRPAGTPGEKSSTSSTLVLLTALALAAAGAWVLIQRRQSGPLAARGQRKLQIEETRPLGGRQYLVVANYDGKKFLLGVTPGQINLLTPLGDGQPVDSQPETKS